MPCLTLFSEGYTSCSKGDNGSRRTRGLIWVESSKLVWLMETWPPPSVHLCVIWMPKHFGHIVCVFVVPVCSLHILGEKSTCREISFQLFHPIQTIWKIVVLQWACGTFGLSRLEWNDCLKALNGIVMSFLLKPGSKHHKYTYSTNHGGLILMQNPVLTLSHYV